MSILQWFSNDEYKQQQIAMFIVEAAIIQFLLSICMLTIFIFTDVDPFFLLFTPIVFFVFYSIIRYTLSGIEYTEVFKEDDVKRAKKRNLFRAFGFSSLLTIMTFLFGSPILDSIIVSLIAGVLLYCMDTVSLRKSYRKNQEL